MRIAVLGTRGIPNNYGGFEQFAEYLSKDLVEKGHDVCVYNSHDHPYQEAQWHGVKLIHKWDPEKYVGTLGQFIYDLLCILDSRRRKFDIILQLGYTSSSVWGWLLPRHSIIVTNMDGLEWKRSKYKKPVQKFLKYAEKLGVKFSDILVADSKGIQKYLKENYNVDSTYIAYGTHAFDNPTSNTLEQYGLLPGEYNLLIARMEPENNIEMILDGIQQSASSRVFLVIGNQEATEFGKSLVRKFKNESRIRFLGAIYSIDVLNNLRYYSNLYFHGHSVGGTNPSLLEAMGSSSMICAHRNEFNAAILEENAFYFSTSEEVAKVVDDKSLAVTFAGHKSANLDKVKTLYLWTKIVASYEQLFFSVLEVKGKSRPV